jgi:transposase
MEAQERDVALPVPMIEPEIVRQIRALAAQQWGSKRIGEELGVSRNTVKRYLREGPAADSQVRPRARRLDDMARARAVRHYDGVAEGNAVVVHQELTREGVSASLRTVQRAVAGRRRELRAAQVATVRYESAPGHQMQIDFGQKLVRVAGELVRVYVLVAVLSYSRRLFVKAFLAERTDDWLEGIAEAFRHFGGVTHTVLGDNARALVARRDRETATVVFTPAYLQFCRDWGVEPRACAPYRARTKGKTESGVKYVKRNALAGREFDSFAGLEQHLGAWTVAADMREHGTTHEAPRARFDRDEHHRLMPLPARPTPVRTRRVWRKVSHDCYVDVDTVRYSVPHRLVRQRVELVVGDTDVSIEFGGLEVARHRRVLEPFAIVRVPAHFDGLWRPANVEATAATATNTPSPLAALGRTLDDYAAAVGGDR